MKFKKFILAVMALAVLATGSSPAQVTPTINKSCIASSPIVCLATTTNLAAPLLVTNNFTPGKHLGLGVVYWGMDATNTGTIGFGLNNMFGGTNGPLKTTTTPIMLTSRANGTTIVRDWLPIPDYTAGPCDGFVLGTITNATVNIAPTATGSVLVTNAWLEYR